MDYLILVRHYGARLLRRKDAGNDTTAASDGARKAPPWLVSASNADLESRTDSLAAIAGVMFVPCGVVNHWTAVRGGR